MNRPQGASRKSARNGFTLVELIVALTVMSAATSALIVLFGASLAIAGEARNRGIAAELAEDRLLAIAAAPESFLWRLDKPEESGLFPIALSENDPKAGNAFSPPAVRLAERSAQDRNETLYRRFRWQAWGKLPTPDAQAYEVTVSVTWLAQGKQRMLALTSSVPRGLVESKQLPLAATEGPAS